MPHARSTCGHSGCGSACGVRYVGPTSHPRDHKIHLAAHGAGQVWTAAIVAGLAVVLTSSMAFAATQADTAPRVKTLSDAVLILSRKLDNIQRLIQETHAPISPEASGQEDAVRPINIQRGQTTNTAPRQLTAEQRTCVLSCEKEWKACQQAAADASVKEACSKAAYQCAQVCVGGATSSPSEE